MKALTIRQPWASLVAIGVKTIETRSRPIYYRGRVAIHAGATPVAQEGVGDWRPYRVSDTDKRWWMEHFASGEPGAPRDEFLPLGAIVATATLGLCIPIVPPSELPPIRSRYIGESSDRPGRVGIYSIDPRSLAWDVVDITDQLPYGDFTPGRWAWVFTEVEPCPPIPAKGRQGLWEWMP